MCTPISPFPSHPIPCHAISPHLWHSVSYPSVSSHHITSPSPPSLFLVSLAGRPSPTSRPNPPTSASRFQPAPIPPPSARVMGYGSWTATVTVPAAFAELAHFGTREQGSAQRSARKNQRRTTRGSTSYSSPTHANAGNGVKAASSRAGRVVALGLSVRCHWFVVTGWGRYLAFVPSRRPFGGGRKRRLGVMSLLLELGGEEG